MPECLSAGHYILHCAHQPVQHLLCARKELSAMHYTPMHYAHQPVLHLLLCSIDRGSSYVTANLYTT